MPTAVPTACSQPRCPHPAVDRGRCAAHKQTEIERGYGPAHREARRSLHALLPAFCGYGCGTLLMPNDDWVAAHVVDGQPEYGYIAACPTCNERAKNGRLEPVPEATRFGKSLAGEGGRNTRAPNQRLSQLRTKRAPATSEVPFA